MRLPWPFGRSQAAPAETEPNSEAGPSPAGPAMPPAPAPPTGAWSGLPPIQRVTGDPPLVAPARTFLEDVPGANQLPPIVGPLGHDVTPLAPAGLVAAPVHTVPSLTSHASLVARPIQRRAAEASAIEASARETAPATSGVAPSPAILSPAASPPADSEPPASPVATPPAPVDEPIRHLAVVQPGAESAPPGRSLTRADAWTAPEAAERPLVHRTNVQASAGSSPQEPASQSTPPGPRASTPARSGDGAAASAVAAPTSTTTSTLAAAPAQTPRRPGLGAPLASAPPSAVQRSPLGLPPGRSLSGGNAGPGLPAPMNPLTGSSPLHTTVQRRGAAARLPATPDGDLPGPARQDRAGSKQAPYVGSPLGGELPSLPVVSRSAAGHAPGAPPEDGPGHGAPIQVSRGDATPAPTASQALPVATASAPSRRSRAAPATPLQRSPTAAPSAAPASPKPPTPERRPLVGARPLRPSTSEAGNQAGDSESPVSVATAVPSPTTATPSDAGTTLWSNPLAATLTGFPAVQRHAPDDLPAMPVFGGATPPAAAGGAPSVQPSRQASPQMTLARPHAASGAAAAHQGTVQGSAIGAAGQAPGMTAGPNGTTVVQMTPAQALATPVIVPTATAIVQRADGAAPPPDDEGEGRSEGELEELARALFPRFQRQLRMEYVYEREARGLPFDS